MACCAAGKSTWASAITAASEEDFEDSDDTGVLPADEVKTLKASLKEAKGMMKLAKRDSAFGDWNSYRAEAERIEKQLARHKALEDEARALKAAIKSTEARKDDLVEQARLKISKIDARQVIVERLGKLLFESYRQYLRADQRASIAAVENLWGKYAVTAKQIEFALSRSAASKASQQAARRVHLIEAKRANDIRQGKRLERHG